MMRMMSLGRKNGLMHVKTAHTMNDSYRIVQGLQHLCVATDSIQVVLLDSVKELKEQQKAHRPA